MTGMMPKKNASTDAWSYPASADVLESAGLHMIRQYIQVRRQTIALFIVTRPIFGLCRGGSSNHQFWWEQPFDFEEGRALVSAGANVVSDDEEEK